MGNKSNNAMNIQSGTQQHEKLGVIKVFEVNTANREDENPYRVELRRQIQSQDKYQKWLKRMRSVDSQQARDVIYLPFTFKYEKTGMCGSSGYAQYFPYVLKSEIKNRRKMSQYFQQAQIWYLLYNLVEAGAIFQKKGIQIGDIHPRNCLLSQTGQMKIVATCSIPEETTNYHKIIQSSINDAYLAPEQIDESLIDKGVYPKVDVTKTDAYSTGMTLLEAATLEDCYYVYNRGPLKVNKSRVQEYQKAISTRYGSNLCQVIGSMLQEQPKKRSHCSEIYKCLHPYEQAILELQPFQLSAAQMKSNPSLHNSSAGSHTPSNLMSHNPNYNYNGSMNGNGHGNGNWNGNTHLNNTSMGYNNHQQNEEQQNAIKRISQPLMYQNQNNQVTQKTGGFRASEQVQSQKHNAKTSNGFGLPSNTSIDKNFRATAF